MNPFTTHKGIVVAVDRANIDTDAIIPKQFLKLIGRTGFGQFLFNDWRYLDNGQPNPEFDLNKPAFKDATILVARNNFGCGSSREHAVWAVAQYGLRVVIAPWRKDADGSRIPGFADIFRNNCVKNGVLTIELSEAEVDQLFGFIKAQPGVQMTVDLPKQTLVLHGKPEQVFKFEIDAGVKDYLLRGLDDIALTLEKEAAITAFEKKHDVQLAAR
ncbi:MAG: 3-isopropylmalate dehydratase small subunit [Verrucomicrobia bacterium]|nr:MAG: 3-isopropylmalate dehydratase small subunit [Verrucomicrobiota bacterium]